MKKSNKLLLYTVLLPLVLLGLIHLSLYARYKAGKFVTGRQLHTELYERKEFPSPPVLLVRGVYNILVIPSDTFAVEYDKKFIRVRTEITREGAQTSSNIPALHYYHKGDTLEIIGYDTLSMKSDPDEKKITSFPSIVLYCRNIRTMGFEGGNISIQQEKRPALAPVSLLIMKNGTCTLGDPHNDRTGSVPDNYDDLRIESINSSIFLNPNIAIRNLHLEMDSTSYIDDNSARIGRLGIRCSDRSKINLHGANLNNLNIVTDSLR
jgi:hypothetical protein